MSSIDSFSLSRLAEYKETDCWKDLLCVVAINRRSRLPCWKYIDSGQEQTQRLWRNRFVPPHLPLAVHLMSSFFFLLLKKRSKRVAIFNFPYLALHLANLIFKQINKTKTIIQWRTWFFCGKYIYTSGSWFIPMNLFIEPSPFVFDFFPKRPRIWFRVYVVMAGPFSQVKQASHFVVIGHVAIAQHQRAGKISSPLKLFKPNIFLSIIFHF